MTNPEPITTTQLLQRLAAFGTSFADCKAIIEQAHAATRTANKAMDDFIWSQVPAHQRMIVKMLAFKNLVDVERNVADPFLDRACELAAGGTRHD